MKIRITQKTPYRGGFLMPGDVVDVDTELAEKWIEQDCAVVPVDDAPKKKQEKAVKDGNG